MSKIFIKLSTILVKGGGGHLEHLSPCGFVWNSYKSHADPQLTTHHPPPSDLGALLGKVVLVKPFLRTSWTQRAPRASEAHFTFPQRLMVKSGIKVVCWGGGGGGGVFPKKTFLAPQKPYYFVAGKALSSRENALLQPFKTFVCAPIPTFGAPRNTFGRPKKAWYTRKR